MNMLLQNILEKIRNSETFDIDMNLRCVMNNIAMEGIKSINDSNREDVYGVLLISNLIYNNTDKSILPLEDGVYDLLVSKYNSCVSNGAPVGAPPLSVKVDSENESGKVNDRIGEGNGIACQKVFNRPPSNLNMYWNCFIGEHVNHGHTYDGLDLNVAQEQRRRDIGHAFPELAGTLDKCKFVLNNQALDRGIKLDDPTVGIFERDFLGKWFGVGYQFNELVCELKYDGVSIEVVVDGDTIIEAYGRGDTANDKAVDYTGVFGGLRFPNASGKVPKGTVFGIKCECIVTYYNMFPLCEEVGEKYTNPRNAVNGALKRLDARKYVKYMTLVPIRTAGLNFQSRITEIEFLNKYYTFGIDLHYIHITGTYEQLLYQVSLFAKDAESVRSYIGFMYDGIVVSIIDENLKRAIGRVNSIDKWSIAVKFNALIKETMFLGYSYSVGQNGVITPKAHFLPVEFMGTTHDNTTAHSFKRVNQMGLKYGDIVTIEYRNDVICYINKSDNAYNMSNPNPVLEFPKVCPSCGTPLVFTEKSATCPNISCPDRNITRVSNMLKKLGIKDFSEAYLKTLGISSLYDFIHYDEKIAIERLGDKLGPKLMQRINDFLSTPIYDYKIIGSIGFSSIAIEKWKMICRNIRIDSIISMKDEELDFHLTAIKGIGEAASKTIVSERWYLGKDINAILELPNLIITYGMRDDRPKVRFTGVRNEELEKMFLDKGFDADGTKQAGRDTSILIVPYEGFTSSKTKKIGVMTLVMTVDQAFNYLINLGDSGYERM